MKAEDIPSGPVIGSKKRKARKHSITHLMPVTAENKGKCVDSPNQIKNAITAGFMVRSKIMLPERYKIYLVV